MPARKFLHPDGRFSIEVRQDPSTHRSTLHVYDNDQEILEIPCVHVVVEAQADQLERAESVDDVINLPYEQKLGNEPAKGGTISDEDLFWAHCSNIQYWIETGMPPEGLASNLSVPILKTFAGRDSQFANDLAFLVEDIVSRTPQERQTVVVERYGSLLPGVWWQDHPDFIQKVSAEVLLDPARDPHSPPALLESLAQSAEPRVRNAVATNRAIPPIAARQLAKDPFIDVRYALARNPHVPPDLLLEFSRYRHILMRESIARNPAAPLEALSTLLENSGLQIQQAILENPACTREFLEQIVATNPSDVVKQIALQQLRVRFQKSNTS